MAKKPKKELVEHLEMPTHAELEKKGVTQCEFVKFANKYSDGKFKYGSKKPKEK